MSTKILARVRTWIASSGLAEGARLPAERELCATLGIGRAELRKALLVLESNGVLTREVGRGTFLAKKPGRTKPDASKQLVEDIAERTGPSEAMNARLAVEPELARLAAMHASPRHLRDLRDLAIAMRSASSWLTYEQKDSDFHDLIAEASGNALLHEVHKIMNGVRFVVVWRRLDTPKAGPNSDYHSFDEHDTIVEALERRDGPAAYKAMAAHLNSTLSTMADASELAETDV
jgi:DNA-binding FadR family transcriptional regulator